MLLLDADMVDLCQSESLLEQTLSLIGWTLHGMNQAGILEQCDKNPCHWMPKRVLEKHRSVCALREQGYSREEIDALPQDLASAGVAEKSSGSSLSQDILWNVDLEAFSVKKQKKLRMIEYPADDNSSLSVETLALIRDSKRRRKSYRGVHTARRSYIEVLREIIFQQTEQLQSSASASNTSGSKETARPEDTRVIRPQIVTANQCEPAESRKDKSQSSHTPSVHRHSPQTGRSGNRRDHSGRHHPSPSHRRSSRESSRHRSSHKDRNEHKHKHKHKKTERDQRRQ